MSSTASTTTTVTTVSSASDSLVTVSSSETLSNFPDISEGVTFVSTDDSYSVESSSSTASLSPSNSSPNNEDEVTISPLLCRKITHLRSSNNNNNKCKHRVTFGLHHNATRVIETYADTWLTKAELKEIRCNGLCDVECNKLYFQGYLQSVDAATIHIQYSKEFHPKGLGHRSSIVKLDDSANQKELMDTLTKVLITGCNLGFRGLEYGSKDARHRRTGRNLAATAIVAKHRLLFTISQSTKKISSKESQFRKYCENLSYSSRMWAHFMAMIDAMAAMPEYSTIPQALLQYENTSTKVPKVVIIPCLQKHSTNIMQRILPTISLLQNDYNGRRGYQRLVPLDEEDDGSFPLVPLEDGPEMDVNLTTLQHPISRRKKTKRLFRKAIQRLKISMDELKVSPCTIHLGHHQ